MTEPNRQIVGIPKVRRLKSCVENWPGCYEGGYDPSCCRFPKSCSCTIYYPEGVKEEDLEPMTEPSNGSGVGWSGVTASGEDVVRIASMFQPSVQDGLMGILTRIAEALEAQVRPTACGERRKEAGPACVLNDGHVGHHASADGRLHWLDDE